MTDHSKALRFLASESSGDVSGLLLRPPGARWLLVLGHGAGAGMRHPFMQALSERLAERDVATLRYQFPYTEHGQKRPNPQPILLATIRSALAEARRVAGDLPLLAGGKSMGGRMTSIVAAATGEFELSGLVFFGFPLHAPGRPSSNRADHLDDVRIPMLFLQGTRDRLADLDFLRPVCERLGERASLHVVAEADHSFHVPKRSGRSDPEVMEEVCDRVRNWMNGLPAARDPVR